MKKILIAIFLFFPLHFIQSQNLTIHIHAMLQGFYRPSSGLMLAVVDPVNHPELCDTAIVNLLDSVYPYNILFSDTSTLTIYGFGNFHFANALVGRSYIVQLMHRNSLEAHIQPPVFIADSSSFFDFTILPKQFCGDADTTNGIALILSGDLNQDGFIATADLAIVDNANLIMTTGYVIEDLNGDGVVDQADVNICDMNNLSNSSACLPIGINKNPYLSETITVFPIPAQNEIAINTSFENYVVFVRNNLGELLFTKKSFSANLEMDITDLHAGIYSLSICSEEMNIHRIFIKQ